MARRHALRRARFFSENPTCIFCGGRTPAQEEDHVPGRVFFKNKTWPEGYVFPACQPCNRATRQDEQLLAFTALLNDAGSDDGLSSEWHARKQALANNFPEVYRQLLPGAQGVRRVLRHYALPRIHGLPLAEHPVVILPVNVVRPALARYGFKLAASLLYRHGARRIIPPEGGCLVFFRTNLDQLLDGIPDDIAGLAPLRDHLHRQGQLLNDQLEVRAGVSPDGDLGAFIVRFRQAFSLVLLAATRLSDLGNMEENGHQMIGRPFHW